MQRELNHTLIRAAALNKVYRTREGAPIHALQDAAFEIEVMPIPAE